MSRLMFRCSLPGVLLVASLACSSKKINESQVADTAPEHVGEPAGGSSSASSMDGGVGPGQEPTGIDENGSPMMGPPDSLPANMDSGAAGNDSPGAGDPGDESTGTDAVGGAKTCAEYADATSHLVRNPKDRDCAQCLRLDCRLPTEDDSLECRAEHSCVLRNCFRDDGSAELNICECVGNCVGAGGDMCRQAWLDQIECALTRCVELCE